jgi:hypothetical protein
LTVATAGRKKGARFAHRRLLARRTRELGASRHHTAGERR